MNGIATFRALPSAQLLTNQLIGSIVFYLRVLFPGRLPDR